MASSQEEGEKLFSTEQVADSTTPAPENENKNGITPITVDSGKSKFASLTKEELMKYATDPFWIRVRWTLFIMFWFIWFLMLFSAIYIVILTPKCQEPSPPVWWQRSPLYKINIKKLPVYNQSSGSETVIDSLQKTITHLQELGIESILLESVLLADKDAPDEIMNYTSINLDLDTINVFEKNVINYAKNKNMHIILEFIPNHSGKTELFARSAVKEEKYYNELYVWYPQNYTSKPDKPPNNWLSVYNNSAWEWKESRRQFYLHQFKSSQPEFNFRNPDVMEFFKNVFKFWSKLGVSGFHLDKTEYLVEDANFKDEVPSRNASFGFNEYGFYYHYNTFELPETVEVLYNWSRIIKNESAILSVSGGVKERRDIADFVLRPLYLSPHFNATDLKDKITKWITAVNQPMWEWKCTAKWDECFPKNGTDGLQMVSFLLPGTPVMELGQEFGPNNITDSEARFDKEFFKKLVKEQSDDAESHFNIFKKLVKLRESPSATYGTFNVTVLNETVLAFTRIKAGNPGYLVVWNVGQNTTFPNLREFSTIPDDLIVVLKTGHVYEDLYPLKNRISSYSVKLPPMAGMVFSFVPVLK